MKKAFGLFLLCGIILLSGCSLIKTIKPEQFQEYLETTYGEDRNFTLVEEGYSNYFELGYGSYYFTDSSLNGKPFYIKGSFYYGKPVFDDEYVQTLYDEKLKEYYSGYFADISSEDIKISDIYITDSYNIPLISFDEYLALIKDNETRIRISAYALSDDYVAEHFNIDEMKTLTADIISSNGLTNIVSVTFCPRSSESEDADYYDSIYLYESEE